MALALIGQDNINTLYDGIAESDTCRDIYPGLLEAMITEHPWRFTIGKAKLTKEADTPENEWETSYLLPTDPPILHLISVHIDDRLLGKENYDIYENRRLYTGDHGTDSSLYVDYQFVPDESAFPPYFIEYIKLRLASQFAIALAEDGTTSKYWGEVAVEYGKTARRLDSRQRHARPIKRFKLTDVRG